MWVYPIPPNTDVEAFAAAANAASKQSPRPKAFRLVEGDFLLLLDDNTCGYCGVLTQHGAMSVSFGVLKCYTEVVCK